MHGTCVKIIYESFNKQWLLGSAKYFTKKRTPIAAYLLFPYNFINKQRLFPYAGSRSSF